MLSGDVNLAYIGHTPGLHSFGGKTLALAPYCRTHLCLWAAATPSISNGAPHRGPPHLLRETPVAQMGATTGAR